MQQLSILNEVGVSNAIFSNHAKHSHNLDVNHSRALPQSQEEINESKQAIYSSMKKLEIKKKKNQLRTLDRKIKAVQKDLKKNLQFAKLVRTKAFEKLEGLT